MMIKCWIGLVAAVWVGLAGVATAAPPLSVYGQLPGFEQTALAPSGERYAVVGMVNGERKLVVLTATGAPVLMMPIGGRKVSDIDFVDDDHLILWVRSTERLGVDFVEDRAELSAAFIVDIPARRIVPVLQRAHVFGGIARYYGAARVDGKLYGYFSAVTLGRDMANNDVWNGSNPDLYRVDLGTGDGRLAAPHADGSIERSWLVDTGGEVAATLDVNIVAGRSTLRGPNSELARAADPVRLALAGFAADGTVAYWRAGADEATLCCYTSGTDKPLFGDQSVGAIFSDKLSRRILGYATEGDHRDPHLLDPHGEARLRAARKAFPGLDVELVGFSADYNRLIVRTSGTGDAGTWWLVDIRTGGAKQIGSAYPAIPTAEVAPVRIVAWHAADGLALEGVLTTPPGREAKSLPLIVLPHGGPAARDYPDFDWWAQALAVQGYAVFQPNFRGSTGYGPALRKAGDGEWGGKMLSDIADGVAALAGQGVVDAKRACIVGASYGGYAALAGVTLQHGLYRCAVAVAPVTDLAVFFAGTEKGSTDARSTAKMWKTIIGTVSPASISPAQHAAEADAPILLIHGTGDTVVPIEQSRIMLARLTRAGKPVEMVTLPGEDHWLSQSATRLAMLEATVAFVRKHNPPG